MLCQSYTECIGNCCCLVLRIAFRKQRHCIIDWQSIQNHAQVHFRIHLAYCNCIQKRSREKLSSKRKNVKVYDKLYNRSATVRFCFGFWLFNRLYWLRSKKYWAQGCLAKSTKAIIRTEMEIDFRPRSKSTSGIKTPKRRRSLIKKLKPCVNWLICSSSNISVLSKRIPKSIYIYYQQLVRIESHHSFLALGSLWWSCAKDL